MDRGLQVRAEALFGPRVPALLRFSRDDFHIGAARKDRTLPGGVVLVRNHRQVRHLLYPLRNMAVELALEASAVDTGIVGFADEQCVKPGALRAVRADPRKVLIFASPAPHGAVQKRQMPFLVASPRLAVCAVKGARFAFIGAKRRPLDRRSRRSRRTLSEGRADSTKRHFSLTR